MPRPSLVTSSGPSPVRGFIAAIVPSPSYGLHAPPRRAWRRTWPSWALRASQSGPPAAEPASHNRFYLSPYYPVFGTRMVMIGQARWRPGRTPASSRPSGDSPARRVISPAGPGVRPAGPGARARAGPGGSEGRPPCDDRPGPAATVTRTAGRLPGPRIAVVTGGPRTGTWSPERAACPDVEADYSLRGLRTPPTMLTDVLEHIVGGGGNRTRVLQYLTRASPGAACCAFLSPGDHASKTPTGSAAVRCPAWPRDRDRR